MNRQERRVVDKESGNASTALRQAAIAHLQSGKIAEAEFCFRQALALDAQDAVLWKSLGEVLMQLGRTEEAVQHFRKALKLDTQYLDAANLCGVLLFKLGRHAEAVECFNISLKLNQISAPLYQLRGVCLEGLGHFEEAQADYEASIALDPSQAETHNNLGSIYSRLGRIAQAIASFDRALELRPDDADIAWNLSLLQLQTGDYERGFLRREARWKLRRKVFSQPLWLGDQPIKGKTILLQSEEGLGDTILYARYVPMVAALGAKVILEVQPALQRLLANVSGVATCIGRSSAPLSLAFDLHCPLTSLPLAFGTRLDTIPPAPYLPAPAAARVKAWEDRLGPHNRFRVGLVWSGNPNQENDHNRSMALRTLAPLLDCDVQFVSLQKAVRDQDKTFLAERPDIVDLTEHLTDFTETAALLSCLDLVISVCTSVAHLAGALDTPVWTMLSFNAYWLWLLNRDDSPWYRSMRLFRQPKRGDWDSVVDRVRLELDGLVSAWRPCS